MSFLKFLSLLPFMKVSKFLREDKIVLVPNRVADRFSKFLTAQEVEHTLTAGEENTLFSMQFHSYKGEAIRRELVSMSFGY